MSAPSLVSTDWLAARLDDPATVVVDGSWYLPAMGRDARAEYDAGHIPGAVFFDIDAIADRSSPLPHMLPAPEAFAEAVSAMGIGDRDTIVVYDGAGLFSAGRVWWSFRTMGARDAAVLDGGMPRWRAEGRPVDTAPSRRPAARFVPRFDRGAVYDLDQVRAAAAGDVQIVDARPAGRFAGVEPEPRPGLRSGHIPGSLNLPLASLLDGGRLRPPAELAAIFARAGVDTARPIATTCGSGVNAAALALALELAGAREVAVYDGSWAEWGARADTPVEPAARDPESGIGQRATPAA